jgi:hypothetical protein
VTPSLAGTGTGKGEGDITDAIAVQLEGLVPLLEQMSRELEEGRKDKARLDFILASDHYAICDCAVGRMVALTNRREIDAAMQEAP